MGNSQGTLNSSTVRTVNESLNTIMHDAHANASNHMTLDGVTIECPDHCGDTCDAKISQIAGSTVTFDVTTTIKDLSDTVNDIGQKLEQNSMSLWSNSDKNISDVYTKNYIENIVNDNCRTDASNNLIVKNSKFKTCNTVLEQNASAESVCKANTVVDVARVISNKVKQEITQNTMGYVIIGIIVAVIALVILGYIMFKNNTTIFVIIAIVIIVIGVLVFWWYYSVGSKSCDSELDCEFNERCKDGKCEIRTCETDDSDCGVYSTCNTKDKRCELKACNSDTSCSITQYCNTITGYCAPLFCRSDADCLDTDTLQCNTDKGICAVKPASTDTNSD